MPPPPAPFNAPHQVWGNLVAFVERLDDELFKSLQVGGCGASSLFSTTSTHTVGDGPLVGTLCVPCAP